MLRQCPKCGEHYYYDEEDQVAGFRSMSVESCPYCKAELSWSMEVEHDTRKLEGNLHLLHIDELETVLDKRKKESEAYKTCQDGSYECYWHNKIDPIEIEIKRRK